MTMTTLVSKFQTPLAKIRTVFVAGSRVRLSKAGIEGMSLMPGFPKTGTVSKSPACYPDSVSVIRDGSKTALHYHTSYWEPIV